MNAILTGGGEAKLLKAEKTIRKTRDQGIRKKVMLVSFSLAQLSVFVGSETLYTEERIRDGNKVL